MGIAEIRALKEKKGSVMSSEEVQKLFKPKALTNTMAGRFHQGQYECSKGSVYFRSKWEANYALYLDWLIAQKKIKDWEYESETFFFDKIKLGTRSYRPDFKIFNLDGSVQYDEVKGYLDSKSKTKLKRMAKYFPQVKVVLIEKAFYSDMMKKLKGLIKFY